MIKPMEDYIVVAHKKIKTASGIVFNEGLKDSLFGVIVAVSDEEKKLKVNDVIVYKNSSTIEINYQNQRYLVVPKKDVLVIMYE